MLVITSFQLFNFSVLSTIFSVVSVKKKILNELTEMILLFNYHDMKQIELNYLTLRQIQKVNRTHEEQLPYS